MNNANPLMPHGTPARDGKSALRAIIPIIAAFQTGRIPRLLGALCALAFCCCPVQAASDATSQSRVQLAIELRDGSRVVGKSVEDALSFHSAALGDMKLSWAGIRSIEFAGTNTSLARLTATNGDGFAITLAAETLRVETGFGQTEMPVKLIRSVRVSPPAGANVAAGPETAQLAIELRDGSHVVGKGLDDALNFHSPAMGDLKLTWAGIRSIEYAGTNTDRARLTATNGDVYEVQFSTPAVHVETSFGRSELPVKLIRSIKVSAAGRAGPWPPGLVSLWSGEGSGYDPAGGNTAALCGNATFADGKIGQAFSLDGVNSYVKIPQSPNLNLTDQITIAFWMKAAADNPMTTVQGLVVSDFYVVEIDAAHGGRWGVNFAVSTTANAPMDASGHTSIVNFTHTSQANGSSAPVTSGQWHHIAATYDGAKLQLYVDGMPWGNPMRETGTLVPMLPKSYLTIGSEDGRTTCPECFGNRYFKGLIDEVAIYNRALPAREIQALCAAQNNGEPMRPPQALVPPGIIRQVINPALLVARVVPAAPDSVEGQLRAGGQSWERTQDPIQAGMFVQDILQGRLNQPAGRGAIAKVTLTDFFIGMDHAWVDFGRGCIEHIRCSELRAIRLLPPAGMEDANDIR